MKGISGKLQCENFSIFYSKINGFLKKTAVESHFGLIMPYDMIRSYDGMPRRFVV